jgi:hypothetical protein
VNSNPQNYFSYSSSGFARESFWIIVNTLLSVSIAYLRVKLDEKDMWRDFKRKIHFIRSGISAHS